MLSDEERRAKVEEVTECPLADQINPVDSLDGPLMLAGILARQRSNDMHDPSCSWARIQREQRRTSLGLFAPPCDCWLSRCVLIKCGKPMAVTGPRRIQRYGWTQHTSEEEGGDWYDAPSIPVVGGCSRCEQQQPICEKRHCMICGTETQ